MKREEAFAFTQNCINGEPATCIAACPFHMDIKAFLKKAGKGRIGAAAQEMNKSLPFPVLISALCDAPCQKACQRSTVLEEEPIAIRLLEQTCANSKENKERKTYRLEALPQKIAVVGAGPVGLSFALHMSRKRFSVTVFDKEDRWGGSVCAHPDFPAFDMEFQKKFADTDVVFRFGEEIADPESLSEYEAVFLAMGKSGSDFGLLDGWGRQFGTTKTPNVFLSGEMAGLSLIEGMAHTLEVAKAMESWIQTGDVSHAAVTWEKTECSRDVPHPEEPKTEHVTPAGKLYTKEEAAKEASRCMQCDCEECMKGCELLTKYKKKPPRIAIDVAQDGMVRNSVSSACITRQTWSCNQCGYCANICDENVDIGGLFELSRKDRVESGWYPPAFHGYWMREMNEAVSESGLLKPAPNGGDTQYLFFPGCRLGGVNPDYTIRSYKALLSLHQETGIWLGCCGIPALWAGEGAAFEAHVEAMKQEWEQMGKPVVIYACASCRRTFARFLPEVPLVSLYELLDRGMKEKKLPLPDMAGTSVKEEYAVFDPCAATGMDELKAAVRNLAGQTGIGLTDYDSGGKCCGYGGHIQLANPTFFDEIADARCKETPAPFLTYCVNCMEVFTAHGKESRHILELIFGLDVSEKAPGTLEEKKENNHMVKKEILETYWKEPFEEKKDPWDAMKVEVPDEVVSDMERLLIPLGDVKKTIWINEDACEGFENQFGEILCRMVTDYITCWVKYRKNGDIYQVMEVYAHRMFIREEEH